MSGVEGRGVNSLYVLATRHSILDTLCSSLAHSAARPMNSRPAAPTAAPMSRCNGTRGRWVASQVAIHPQRARWRTGSASTRRDTRRAACAPRRRSLQQARSRGAHPFGQQSLQPRRRCRIVHDVMGMGQRSGGREQHRGAAQHADRMAQHGTLPMRERVASKPYPT